jgi:uncharacterized membrane protein YfcA
MLEIRIIYTILVGLVFGIMVGTTGIFPGGFMAIVLYYLGVFPDFKVSLGTILFLFALPFSIGGIYEYHKAGKIDYKIGMVLFVMAVIGSYLGAKFSFYYHFSDKSIKYAQAIISIIITVITFYAAINSK